MGGGGNTDAGYAAVDALVALMILGTTIAFSLRAAETAKQAAVAAREIRQAALVLQTAMETTPLGPGLASGHDGAFEWRVYTRATPVSVGATLVNLCVRSARAEDIRTGRHYELATTVICPPRERP